MCMPCAPLLASSGGGNGKYVKSHEGFALRMPPAELGAWQALNDKGELVDVPRPAVALRVWNAASGAYAAVDPHLAGAPDTAEACDAWCAPVNPPTTTTNTSEAIAHHPHFSASTTVAGGRAEI